MQYRLRNNYQCVYWVCALKPVQIWDMRHHRARCIKTFGPAPGSGPSSAETVVQDLIVAPAGDLLFSASGNFVNIWDLKK